MSLSARARTVIVVAVAALAAVLFAVLRVVPAPPPAEASTGQLAMFEEDVRLLSDPAGTLRQLRSLGVGIVRMSVHWNQVAPNPYSPTRPAGFNASDPAAYPSINWTPYDKIVQIAQQDGIAIELLLTGPAPVWATPAGAPSGVPQGEWKPSASEYGQFARAVATRYSGSYRPCSTCSTLPRVRYWEIYNEPNWGGFSLAPQQQGGQFRSPAIYRGLLDAGWSALQSTGHGGDTILIGSLSPRGEASPGIHLTMRPLQFIGALYCVNSRFRKLSGGAAGALGCPTTAAGSAGFAAAHPALFHASGFGIHPYPYFLPPTQADSSDPNFVEFNEIPRMETALDRAQRAYGSHARFQIYNTEYGYETNPPNRTVFMRHHFVSPSTAAFYINWAEYISWRNPRIATTMQYLLYDPNPNQGAGTFGQGGFATGLLFANGRPKADYYAYRMPLFLPVTATRRGRRLEVWGCVRPAHYARLDSGGAAQRVQIQFRRGSRGAFRTANTVLVTSARGYFDVRMTFPSSGAVRLAWAYPHGPTIYSRTVGVTIR